MIMEVGRVCRMLRGKDAGKYCVIVEIVDKNYVLADGKGMKRQKTNVTHIEPLPRMLDITKGASTEDVTKKLEKEELP